MGKRRGETPGGGPPDTVLDIYNWRVAGATIDPISQSQTPQCLASNN